MLKWLIKLITVPTESSRKAAAAAALITASRVNGFNPVNWGKTSRQTPPAQ